MDEARSSMAGISLSSGGLEGRSLFTNNKRVEFLKKKIKIKTALVKNKMCECNKLNIYILK